MLPASLCATLGGRETQDGSSKRDLYGTGPIRRPDFAHVTALDQSDCRISIKIVDKEMILSPLLGQPFGPIRRPYLDHVTLQITILTLDDNKSHGDKGKCGGKKCIFKKILIFTLGTCAEVLVTSAHENIYRND